MTRTLHHIRIRRLFVAPAVVAGLAFAGLGGPAPAAADACPTTNPPNELMLAGGTPQTGKLHAPFADMFQVTLANTNGCPLTTQVAGTAVTFTAPSTGASGTFAASGSNTTTVGANAAGGANAPPFTANGSAGSYTVTATSGYGSVSFSLTNTGAGIAASITAGAPTSQTAAAGGRYGRPLQATVLDANGNPVEGVSVIFALGSGTGGAGGGAASSAGASFDGGGAQATEITNASGTATSPLFTANGTAGAFTATAATADVIEPAGFSLDNLAGTPPTITALAPAKQAAIVGAHYAKPLQVKVLDASGKPIQGASVTFTLGGSGGGGGNSTAATAGASFDGGSAQVTEATDATGIATSPLFTANGGPGTFAATATTTGTTKAVTFSLDNVGGKESTIAPAGAAKRSATVAAGFGKPLQVKVRNGSGKPVAGTSVTFTLGSGGGGAGSASAAGASFVGGATTATETTDAAGVATSPRLTANSVAGAFDATATTAGTREAATFALRNLPARPATISAGVAAGESTIVGTRFPIRLGVTVEDAHANPVPGAVVTFAAPTRGPGGRFDGKGRRTVRVRTDAVGVAVAPPFLANHSQGGYVVRAVVHGAARAAAFALVNQAGP